jgi:hypothetical protein
VAAGRTGGSRGGGPPRRGRGRGVSREPLSAPRTPRWNPLRTFAARASYWSAFTSWLWRKSHGTYYRTQVKVNEAPWSAPRTKRGTRGCGFWLGQRCLGEKGLGFWSGAVDAAVFWRASLVIYLPDSIEPFGAFSSCHSMYSCLWQAGGSMCTGEGN